MDKTIIYITNNKLDKKILELCQDNIRWAIGDKRLISVSQEPIDFGDNICMGKLPRSSLSINLQMMEALKNVDTEYIAIAEHDVLYTPEHFDFIPPDDRHYYNENTWLLQTQSEYKPEANGMFSYFPKRMANSQLICRTETMIRSTQDRIDMMSDPSWLRRYPSGRIGEAGFMTEKHVMSLTRGKTILHIRKRLLKYIDDYEGVLFRTTVPNIDIRHRDNLTKNRRGYRRTFQLPYWGEMERVLKTGRPL